jgi:hypothetical protein
MTPSWHDGGDGQNQPERLALGADRQSSRHERTFYCRA